MRKTKNNIIAWLRRNCDSVEIFDERYFYGKYHGHNVRVTHTNILEVGYKDFDRWANSVAFETVLVPKDIQKQMNAAITAARSNHNEPEWRNSVRLINAIFHGEIK